MQSTASTFPLSTRHRLNLHKRHRRSLDVAAMHYLDVACTTEGHEVGRIKTSASINYPRHDMVYLETLPALSANEAGKVVTLLNVGSQEVKRTALHFVGASDTRVWIKACGKSRSHRHGQAFLACLLSQETSTRERVAGNQQVSGLDRLIPAVTNATHYRAAMPISTDDFNGKKPTKPHPINWFPAYSSRRFRHARHVGSVKSETAA